MEITSAVRRNEATRHSGLRSTFRTLYGYNSIQRMFLRCISASPAQQPIHALYKGATHDHSVQERLATHQVSARGPALRPHAADPQHQPGGVLRRTVQAVPRGALQHGDRRHRAGLRLGPGPGGRGLRRDAVLQADRQDAAGPCPGLHGRRPVHGPPARGGMGHGAPSPSPGLQPAGDEGLLRADAGDRPEPGGQVGAQGGPVGQHHRRLHPADPGHHRPVRVRLPVRLLRQGGSAPLPQRAAGGAG